MAEVVRQKSGALDGFSCLPASRKLPLPLLKLLRLLPPLPLLVLPLRGRRADMFAVGKGEADNNEGIERCALTGGAETSAC